VAEPGTIEEYFATLPEEARHVLERLRTILRAAAPEATERISYRMPAFEEEGRILVWYAAFRDHFSMFPSSEGVREALGDDLVPYLAGKGTIRFPADEPIPQSLVRTIVEARRQENTSAAR
jgi:uncharacterized protein YdhG (YjbR/CyaY superfamily)